MPETAQRFHRPPRQWPPAVPPEAVRIAQPPIQPQPPQHSILSTLFPIVGAVGIVGFALIYGRSAFLWIAGAMVTLLILFGFGMRWSQRNQVRKQAARDSRRYSIYLKNQDRELARSGEVQHEALARLYPAIDRLWSMLLRKEGVWERRPSDPDFLHVRLGTGSVELDRPVQLDLGFNPLAEYQEASLNEAKALVGYRGRLPHEPVVVDLDEHGILAVTGDRGRTRAWARSLVSQLAGFRAPQDLRIVTAVEPADVPAWEWAKWLPHLRLEHTVPAGPDEAPLPALALARSAAELDALLTPEIGRRAEQLRRLAEAGSSIKTPELLAPELVVLVDGFRPDHPATELAVFRDVLARARQLKVVVVLLCDAIELEPGHVDARLEIPERGKATFTVAGPGGAVIDEIEPDQPDTGMAEVVARALAPLRLDDGGEGERSLAAEVRLLDLLGAVDGELRVPIGIGDDGGTVMLDLKQSAEGGMGPHGILVGATGSGKSELLRSVVAGLAATHSPERLSFVLVDFKGGAAFAPLAGLPHVAGLITNLNRDLSLVDRMHEALVGEQERRQALLRDAGDLDDVRAYRDRRAADPSLPPLPDLLVIVDEFAELLAARPEFLDLFARVGRVGRSLGIHLLLSSQRLDEGRLRGLESHLRYRICLRTFSAAESKLVLGTSDAYLLPSLPGLGFLKVDTEIYRQLRGALVSGAHRVAIDAPVTTAEVRTFDTSTPAPAAAPPGEVLEERTDLDVLLERITGEPVHQVWVPPLPEALPLDAVLQEASHGPLEAVLGELDLPAEQRKVALTLDLTGSAGHVAVVGAPRSGKSTVLRTLALSLAARYTPEEVRFYGIDLGGGLLGALEGLPHMGGVARRAEREAVVRVVRQLAAELEEREEQLGRLGLESIADARAARARGALPPEAAGRLADVVLLVDGWASLRSDFGELELEIHALAAAGLGLGVHVVVAANRWADIRSALLDNLGTRLELKLNDPLDSDVGRKIQEALPGGIPGRGLTAAGATFQAALPRLDGVASDEGASAALEAAAAEIAAGWDGPGAEPIRMLPAQVDPGVLPAPETGAIAIGLEERALGPVSIALGGTEPHLLAFGDSGSGKSSLLRLLARGLATAYEPGELRLHVLDLRRSLVDLAELPHVDTYAVAAQAAQQAMAQLAQTLVPRVPSAEADALLRAPTWDGPRHVVLVDDYDLLVGPTGSPLAPLLDFLPVAPEVGLHVVLARRVAGSARTAFEPVLSRLRELGSPGLLFDGEPVEGPLLGGQKAQPQPPGRALLVRRGEKPVTVQIALATPANAPSAPLGHPSRP